MRVAALIGVSLLMSVGVAKAADDKEYIHGVTYDGAKLVTDHPGFGKSRLKLQFDCTSGRIQYDTWEFTSLKEFVDFVASEDRLPRYGALVVIGTECNLSPDVMGDIKQLYRSKFSSEQNELAAGIALGVQQTGQAISQASQAYSQNMKNSSQAQQAKQVTCRTTYNGNQATTRCY